MAELTPEQRVEVDEILKRALAMPAGAGERYIADRCSHDATLRAEALSLLNEVHGAVTAGDSLDRLAEVPESVSRVAPATALPRRIGDFSIKSEIASGGMGTVYLALQEHPHRKVALKVMKKGIASRSALRRFELEAQTLARLRHPNVAQVYDAGTHDDGSGGVPYFAMEYIPRKSITDYAGEKKLGNRERLDLFAKVCDAVHHGHQKGIIHRDLKPENILVDSSGEPKIIDFGVARSTDSDLAVTTLQTDVGQLIGTLQYMSPEQCAADPDDIDTRSDVYALGVVLYELMCGQCPYEVSRTAIHEVVRIIREETPAKPSTINRTLRGDVETITLKALEKDRERRYRSTEAMADDLRHYLRGEPIQARPPTFSYQLSRFVLRNKLLAGGTMTLFVVLLIAITVIGLALAQATTQAEKATRISQFTQRMLSAVDPSIAQTMDTTLLRKILDESSTRVDAELGDEPEIQALLLTTIGKSYVGIGAYATARPFLERSLAIRRRVFGDNAPETLDALLALGVLLEKQGSYELAEQHCRGAYEGYQDVRGLQHRETLTCLSTLGRVLGVQCKWDEAEEALRKSLDGQRRVLGDDDPNTMETTFDLAALLMERRRPEGAEPLVREALQRRRRILGDDHPETIASIHQMGGMLHELLRFDEAEPYYVEAVERQSRVLGPDHHTTLISINDLGLLYRDQRRPEDAEHYFRIALDGFSRAIGPDHKDTLTTSCNMGALFLSQARLEEAEEHFARVLEVRRRVLGPGHGDTATAMLFMGEVLLAQDNPQEAEQHFRGASDGRRNLLGDDHEMTLDAAHGVAQCLLMQGRLEDAEPIFRHTAAGYRRVFPKGIGP